MPNERGVGFVDYVLWGADGKPLPDVSAEYFKKAGFASGKYEGKERLLKPNLNAFQMGLQFARSNLKDALGLKVQRAYNVGDQLVITDVFSGARTPAHLTSTEFLDRMGLSSLDDLPPLPYEHLVPADGAGLLSWLQSVAPDGPRFLVARAEAYFPEYAPALPRSACAELGLGLCAVDPLAHDPVPVSLRAELRQHRDQPGRSRHPG